MATREDLMKLQQCNFKISRWHKRRLKEIAEDEGVTLEALLQDAVDDLVERHLDEIDDEACFSREQVDYHRTRLKYRERAPERE